MSLRKLLNLAGAKKLYDDLRARLNQKYEKPATGIPASDLASAVQTSLEKADSAYQKPSGGIPASDMASGVIPDPTDIIDDTAGSGDTSKVWSADKSASAVSTLNNAISQKYEKPASGIPATDLASGVIPSVPVQDVQVNGVTVLSQGVANVPMATDTTFGVVARGAGLWKDANNKLIVDFAGESQVKAGTSTSTSLCPGRQQASVFYGLAKAAGADMASLPSVTVGQYPEAQKIAIQKMLGIYEPPFELVNDITLETESRIELTADSNGTPYNFLSIYVFVSYPANLTAPTDGFGRFRFYDESDNYVASETGRYIASTSACNKAVRLIKKGNMTSCDFTRITTSGGYAGWQTKNLNTPSTRFDMGNITKILTPNNDTEPAGTNIKIYAQRAY